MDSSALVKLVVPEPETVGLLAELARHDEWLSASVTVTEVVRATRRWLDATRGDDAERAARMGDAESLLRRVGLMDVDVPLVWAAGGVDPSPLRTVDALHLAAALQIAADIEGLVTYDARLAAAATAAGIRVHSPA